MEQPPNLCWTTEAMQLCWCSKQLRLLWTPAQRGEETTRWGGMARDALSHCLKDPGQEENCVWILHRYFPHCHGTLYLPRSHFYLNQAMFIFSTCTITIIMTASTGVLIIREITVLTFAEKNGAKLLILLVKTAKWQTIEELNDGVCPYIPDTKPGAFLVLHFLIFWWKFAGLWKRLE